MVARNRIAQRGNMQNKFFKPLCVLTILIAILSACNMPGSSAATEAVIPPTETASITPEPSSTPTEAPPTETPTETATETPLATITDTATPVPPVAKVNRESNCRIGPGNVYTLVDTYQAEKQLDVVAKDLGGGYWFVRNPDKPEDQCYILGQNITITGDTDALPKFTPQPSPTAAPYFDASLKKIDSCNGQDYALFTVENKGSIPFRSVYIRVKDLKNEKTVEQALNAFDLRVKCTLAKNIAPLDPGGIGYVASPVFTWNVGNDKLQAVLMLCTEKDLKGSCVTRTFEVTP